MLFGITLAWSSVVGPQIVQNENYKFWISKKQFGFVVGAMSLGAACSCVFSGIVRHSIGTKRTILFFSLPAAVGSIFLTIPWNLYSVSLIFLFFILDFCAYYSIFSADSWKILNWNFHRQLQLFSSNLCWRNFIE